MTDTSIQAHAEPRGAVAGVRALVLGVALGMSVATASAQERLLTEVLEFAGAVEFVQHDVPGMVLGVIRNDETAVVGFGHADPERGTVPDGDTMMRIGSITKVFTGHVLAHLVADGTVALTDPAARHLGPEVRMPGREGMPVRLIDLVTHTSGLPREIDQPFEEGDAPFARHTREAYAAELGRDPLLFAPGAGMLYSNFGFNVLAWALEDAAEQSFDAMLGERVLVPLGMTSTTYEPSQAQRARLMRGHGFDGEALPFSQAGFGTLGSGGLYSSAKDMLRWLGWHLDRHASDDAEVRLINHAAWVMRDGLVPVYGMDESGFMDAMALGWVIMMPDGERPLILQKAGGMQGVFSYVAFAPARGIGVFAAINRFDFGAIAQVTEMLNTLMAQLEPR